MYNIKTDTEIVIAVKKYVSLLCSPQSVATIVIVDYCDVFIQILDPNTTTTKPPLDC